jgi:hypothetical protein
MTTFDSSVDEAIVIKTPIVNVKQNPSGSTTSAAHTQTEI